MATTRDQYVGLKLAVESTRMKVRGCEEMDGSRRWICIMFADADVDEESVVFGGTKTPSERNVFAFEVRSREEAEGERRIMGWSRFWGRFWRFATRAGWGAGSLASGRVRRKVAATFR